MRLDSSALKGFLVGTVVSTLLLAAQSGRGPMREAAWILVGATLTMVTEAYGSHVASHEDAGVGGYLVGLTRNIAHELPLVVASLPTVLLLALAAVFGWPDDQQHPDGSVTIGYTTIGLNLNVVLLFIWAAFAARQAGFSVPWRVLFGFINAGLGLLIVTIELALG
jgi:hypothetical protein